MTKEDLYRDIHSTSAPWHGSLPDMDSEDGLEILRDIQQFADYTAREAVEKYKNLLRETAIRANLTFPKTEEEEQWFEEGTGQVGNYYFERLMNAIEKEKEL